MKYSYIVFTIIMVFLVALPVITKQPKSIVVQTFSIGSFECTARSYGNVSIVWKRLNSELPLTAKITVSKTLNMITSVLKLESIGYYEGYYYCAIENSAGVINSTLAYYEISGIRIFVCTVMFKIYIHIIL